MDVVTDYSRGTDRTPRLTLRHGGVVTPDRSSRRHDLAASSVNLISQRLVTPTLVRVAVANGLLLHRSMALRRGSTEVSNFAQTRVQLARLDRISHTGSRSLTRSNRQHHDKRYLPRYLFASSPPSTRHGPPPEPISAVAQDRQVTWLVRHAFATWSRPSTGGFSSRRR
jgi:hypothetical protein